MSLRAQTGKYLLRTQNVSEQNQKHFLCHGHNKCCARGQTGKHLYRQQCVRNIVSSFASSYRLRQLAFFRLRQSGQMQGKAGFRVMLRYFEIENAPINMLHLFKETSSVHSYNTRSSTSGNLYVQNSRLEMLRRSFSRLGVRLWNEIPCHMRVLQKKKGCFERRY